MTDLRFLDILKTDDSLKEKVRLWRNKDDIRKFMVNREIISRAAHSAWLEGLKKSEETKFWVVFAGDTPIGAVYLNDINRKALTSEWGFYIGEESHRGKGLSKLILHKLMEIFFDEMRFKLLITKVFSINHVALKVYKGFGFKENKRLSHNGKEEIIVLRFSDDDWLRCKK